MNDSESSSNRQLYFNLVTVACCLKEAPGTAALQTALCCIIELLVTLRCRDGTCHTNLRSAGFCRFSKKLELQRRRVRTRTKTTGLMLQGDSDTQRLLDTLFNWFQFSFHLYSPTSQITTQHPQSSDPQIEGKKKKKL